MNIEKTWFFLSPPNKPYVFRPTKKFRKELKRQNLDLFTRMVIPPNFSPAETPPGEEWISWAAAQRMAAAWLLSRTGRWRNLRRRPAQQRRHQRQSHSNAGFPVRVSILFVFW